MPKAMKHSVIPDYILFIVYSFHHIFDVVYLYIDWISSLLHFFNDVVYSIHMWNSLVHLFHSLLCQIWCMP